MQHEEAEWTGRRDPVLTAGLKAVSEVTNQHACEELTSAPPDVFDWPRLFKLQMAYLFLWTVIERYTALAYGPALEPGEKVKYLGEDPAFARAEPPRVSWRLQPLRGWSNEKKRQVPRGDTQGGGSAGAYTPG